MVDMELVDAYKGHGIELWTSFATCRASVGEAVDVAKHLGPKLVLRERGERFVSSKISH